MIVGPRGLLHTIDCASAGTKLVNDNKWLPPPGTLTICIRLHLPSYSSGTCLSIVGIRKLSRNWSSIGRLIQILLMGEPVELVRKQCSTVLWGPSRLIVHKTREALLGGKFGWT
jgi:hypothetical protein